jgi:predicted PurR-regulated permease PerM
LRIFATVGVWLVMIVVLSWPLMLRLQARLGGRRKAAVAVLVCAWVLILVIPLALIVNTITRPI